VILFVAVWHETCVDDLAESSMPRVPADPPKYLMCARALALLSSLAAGAAGCASSLVPEGGPKDATDQTYDGSFLGTAPAYDGGVIGLGIDPDAHPTPYDGGVTGVGPAPPYDGGVVGVRINPDANVRSDAQASPYDGGFFGVRINPDAF
jgi:hypothetical protein